jgi:alanine-glyoxylate transaminase/serine-glyoxylate transaminase/serine-pyruvate transaminase
MDSICMIPGPVEFDSSVLSAMATKATSHVDKAFIKLFSNAIKDLRSLFYTAEGQPIVVAGSGTLTWDMTAANLIQDGDRVLLINTGVFGDWLAECLTVYGADVTQIKSHFGQVAPLDQIEAILNKNEFKMVCMTHVDTSTSVLVNVKQIASLVKRINKNTLVVVDAVCSAAAEELRMDDWQLDVIMTSSQKAIGVPPGLAIMILSPLSVQTALNRKSKPKTYFGSFSKWVPIMNKYEQLQPSYFATPPVQLIMALGISLTQILEEGLEHRFEKHIQVSNNFKESLKALGLTIVPTSNDHAAHTLTAIYYPPNISPQLFLKSMADKGVVVAGGLHPEFAAKYFRVGHM